MSICEHVLCICFVFAALSISMCVYYAGGQVGQKEIQISSQAADGLHSALSKLYSSPSLSTECFSMSLQGPEES